MKFINFIRQLLKFIIFIRKLLKFQWISDCYQNSLNWFLMFRLLCCCVEMLRRWSSLIGRTGARAQPVGRQLAPIEMEITIAWPPTTSNLTDTSTNRDRRFISRDFQQPQKKSNQLECDYFKYAVLKFSRLRCDQHRFVDLEK